jgi:hypothetical protein
MGEYDERFECFDDSACYFCHRKLPADIEEGTPQDRGYCSARCENGTFEPDPPAAAIKASEEQE